jgi:lipopolysaccharide transport system permease protein
VGRHVIVIDALSGSVTASLGEVWAYRELLINLALRSVKVRYKQTVLGVAWAMLQPLTLMLAFTLFFHRAVGDDSGGIPYSLFVLAGLLPWTFFAAAVNAASQSVTGGSSLVTKVYFPRLILPLSSVGSGLVDLLIASLVLPPLMMYYRIGPGLAFWLLPVTVLGLAATAVGVGAALTALTIRYRDFRFVIPFMVQVWMFATPAVYMRSDDDLFGSPRGWLLGLNPAQCLIRNLRASILDLPPDYAALAISLAIALALLAGGCMFFHRWEGMFADEI